MEHIAPKGTVYQAGTLSGNPLAMAAGLATLQSLATQDYAALARRTDAFSKELEDIVRAKGVPVWRNHSASSLPSFLLTLRSQTLPRPRHPTLTFLFAFIPRCESAASILLLLAMNAPSRLLPILMRILSALWMLPEPCACKDMRKENFRYIVARILD